MTSIQTSDPSLKRSSQLSGWCLHTWHCKESIDALCQNMLPTCCQHVQETKQFGSIWSLQSNVLLFLVYSNLFYLFWACRTCHALAMHLPLSQSHVPQVSRCYIPLIARTAASVDDLVLESSLILYQSRNNWRAIGVAEVLEVRVAENQDLTEP